MPNRPPPRQYTHAMPPPRQAHGTCVNLDGLVAARELGVEEGDQGVAVVVPVEADAEGGGEGQVLHLHRVHVDVLNGWGGAKGGGRKGQMNTCVSFLFHLQKKKHTGSRVHGERTDGAERENPGACKARTAQHSAHTRMGQKLETMEAGGTVSTRGSSRAISLMELMSKPYTLSQTVSST